jgi:lipopolysaccharide transport system permease protein
MSITVATNTGREQPITLGTRRARSGHFFDVLFHLVGREFRLRYRRTTVGWVWSLIQPLVRFGVLGFFFSRVLKTGVPNFAAFLFVGIVCWIWFNNGVIAATKSVVFRKDMLTRNNVSRLTVPLTAILVETIDFLVAVPLIILFASFGGEGLSGWAVLSVPIAALQLLFIVAVGLVLCTMNVRFRDVGIMADLVLFVWNYATVVFYTLDRVPSAYRNVVKWNPMSVLIGAQRAVLLDAHAPNWNELGVIGLVILALVGLGIWTYQRSSPNFLDEL